MQYFRTRRCRRYVTRCTFEARDREFLSPARPYVRIPRAYALSRLSKVDEWKKKKTKNHKTRRRRPCSSTSAKRRGSVSIKPRKPYTWKTSTSPGRVVAASETFRERSKTTGVGCGGRHSSADECRTGPARRVSRVKNESRSRNRNLRVRLR